MGRSIPTRDQCNQRGNKYDRLPPPHRVPRHFLLNQKRDLRKGRRTDYDLCYRTTGSSSQEVVYRGERCSDLVTQRWFMPVAADFRVSRPIALLI